MNYDLSGLFMICMSWLSCGVLTGYSIYDSPGCGIDVAAFYLPLGLHLLMENMLMCQNKRLLRMCWFFPEGFCNSCLSTHASVDVNPVPLVSESPQICPWWISMCLLVNFTYACRKLDVTINWEALNEHFLMALDIASSVNKSVHFKLPTLCQCSFNTAVVNKSVGH
jgi:hypothetical protein